MLHPLNQDQKCLTGQLAATSIRRETTIGSIPQKRCTLIHLLAPKAIEQFSPLNGSISGYCHGDRRHDRIRYSSGVRRNTDSVGIRIWRSALCRPLTRVASSPQSCRSAGGTNINHHRCHHRRPGLAKNPRAQHGLARLRLTFWKPAGTLASYQQSSTDREDDIVDCTFSFLRVLPFRTQAVASQNRQLDLALRLRILRRNTRRSLRYEWSTAGDLRSDATMVAPTLSRHLARILSSRKHFRHGRILVRRSVGTRRNALLPGVVARYHPSNLARQAAESSSARRNLPQICVLRAGRHRRSLVRSSFNRLKEARRKLNSQFAR